MNGESSMAFQKRNSTRVDLWLNVFAEVKFDNRRIDGKVKNLGSQGMFLETTDQLPIRKALAIKLFFRLKNSRDLLLTAAGTVVWKTDNGIGIQFDKIDIDKLRECVVAMINDD